MLGAFHSASVVLRFKEPKVYNFIKNSCLTEIMFDGMKNNEEIIDKALQTAIKVLEGMSDSSLYRKPLKWLRSFDNGRLYRLMVRHIRFSEWSVISHGDIWTNNLLFRHDSNGLDVKVVDLQTLRCSSPVIDILHLMYSSVSLELRKTHLDDFLLEYHKAFVGSVEDNLKDEHCNDAFQQYRRSFTLETLKDEYQKKKKFGLGIGLWLLPMITFDPNTLPDMNVETLDEISLSDKLTPEYKRRILGLLDEFYFEDDTAKLIS